LRARSCRRGHPPGSTAAGAGRTGSRIHSAISYAIALASAQGKLVIRDGFLWSADMTTPPLRDRSTLDGPGRDLAMIAPQEIDLAIAQVVRDSYGTIPPDRPCRRAPLRLPAPDRCHARETTC
jgi:hypothetical protein